MDRFTSNEEGKGKVKAWILDIALLTGG